MGLSQRTVGAGAPFGYASYAALSRLLVYAACLSGFSASALAQLGASDQPQETGTAQRAWSIVPNLTLQETFTDNASLSNTNRQSEWISDVSPGIRIDGRTKRLSLHADYRVHELLYAQGTRNNQTQQSLSSFATLEAVERFLFVDMSGSIMQQRVSAFGTESPSYSVNSNNTETSTYRLSPYIKGTLGGYVDYEGRYERTTVRGKGASVPRSDLEGWSGRLIGQTPFALLGWSVDASHQKTEYQDGLPNESARWRGFLNFLVLPQLRLSVSAGKERNNFISREMTSYNTHGFGFDWRPTERTNVSAFKEKRFFGDGHTVTLAHRMPRSSIKYSDSRDVSVIPNQSGTAFMTIYDMLYVLKASEIPDQTTRAAAISSLLAANGIAPNTFLAASLLTGQATVQRRQELSYVLLGARNSLTLALVRGHDERLGTTFLAGGDLSRTSSINQQGVNLGWSHQLSGLTSLSVIGARTHSTSGSDADLQTTQNSLSASVATRLGAKTHGSVMVRRSVFDASGGQGTSYTENAVSGMVSVDF
jgi:uncharacterized protein (PEP-CTERM system associated)